MPTSRGYQDIKPANVMMAADGTAKVTDFGLAMARVMAGEQGIQAGKGGESLLASSHGMTGEIYKLSRLMGHSSVEVTEYLKIFNLRTARQNQEQFSAVSTLNLLSKRKREKVQ